MGFLCTVLMTLQIVSQLPFIPTYEIIAYVCLTRRLQVPFYFHYPFESPILEELRFTIYKCYIMVTGCSAFLTNISCMLEMDSSFSSFFSFIEG